MVHTMTFTDAERTYLASQELGRLATVAPNGAPQNKPVGFHFNPQLGTIDVGGFGLDQSSKFRNIQLNPNVALVVDDLVGEGMSGTRFLEVRGMAEAVVDADPTSAGDGVHGLSSHLIRVNPRRVIAWNIDPQHPGLSARDVPSGAGAELMRTIQVADGEARQVEG
jgi:pyridoxamine 5'-phosphate oxidase family protein